MGMKNRFAQALGLVIAPKQMRGVSVVTLLRYICLRQKDVDQGHAS